MRNHYKLLLNSRKYFKGTSLPWWIWKDQTDGHFHDIYPFETTFLFEDFQCDYWLEKKQIVSLLLVLSSDSKSTKGEMVEVFRKSWSYLEQILPKWSSLFKPELVGIFICFRRFAWIILYWSYGVVFLQKSKVADLGFVWCGAPAILICHSLEKQVFI